MSEKKDMINTNDKWLFDYKWGTVIQGFWNKYPHPKLEFIQYNKAIELQVEDDNKLKIKRLMYAKKMMIWGYFLEEIHIDLSNNVMDIQTRLVKQSSLSKLMQFDGIERVKYSANDINQTAYQKFSKGSGFLQKLIKDLNKSFKLGCEIVEDRCKEIKSLQPNDI